MQPINTQSGQFQDGDPFSGVDGTPVTAAWLNQVQAEILGVIAAAGLQPAAQAQLLQALQTLFAPANTVTQPLGDRNPGKAATSKFVADALGAWAIVDCSGNQNIVLAQPQWGAAILICTGLLTGNITLTVPAQGDQHKIVNKTTGPYSVTIKPAGGNGVSIPQGAAYAVFYDGQDLRPVEAPDTSSAGLIYYFAG